MNSYDYCPDPERARNNIETFLDQNPPYRERFRLYEREIALLFSYSQFLANFAISYPERLFQSLENLHTRQSERRLRLELSEILTLCDEPSDAMKAVRIFKRAKLLHITLRDILALQDTQSVLYDLSILAEVILSVCLEYLIRHHERRYGTIDDNSITVIALGKLGARELNYSSDVDLIFVYRNEGESYGVSTVGGTLVNKLTAQQYYSKLVEDYTRFLSKITDEGFIYRVDLRLRPQGQKGPIAMSLRAYEEYYESWGQLWERAALLRSTPVAGDLALGKEFCEMISPFIYRRYLDTETINSLRNMKSQVEHLKPDTISRDIKRGYGGIREIEFFIQIFQLIYGGREPIMREKSTLVSLNRLLDKKLIGPEDFQRLFEAYLFLRTLENRLQQLNDLQTHSLPSSENEITILAKKMGFGDAQSFLSRLQSIRQNVRAIYDSLLETNGEAPVDFGLLDNYYWDAGSPIEGLLMAELSNTRVVDRQKAIYCLMKIKNTMAAFQTLRGRRLMEQTIPVFVSEAIKSPNPDRALVQLVDFSQVLATNESYLQSVIERSHIIPMIVFVLAHSDYLSQILKSRAEYLDSLLEGSLKTISQCAFRRELQSIPSNYTTSTSLRIFKKKKELALGIAFLNKDIELKRLTRGLTNTAETILYSLRQRIIHECGIGDELAIIAFGKLGAREMTFNSDLDIVFVTSDDPKEEHIKASQALIRDLMSYTKEGYLYKVDTRLRPEGSKGPLVISLKSLKKYYLDTARLWELLALIKARPLSPISPIGCSFTKMKKEILQMRGPSATKLEVFAMRERLYKELSKETSDTINIKLGRGGIKDIEFTVQYLQMIHCTDMPSILSQCSLEAMRRLYKAGLIGQERYIRLRDCYSFLRQIEVLQRLRNETMLKTTGQVFKEIAMYFETDEEGLFDRLKETKKYAEDFLKEHLL